jgi:hypothetical protein
MNQAAVAVTWTPSELVGQALQLPLQPFLQACQSPYLLLVPLEDPNGELAAGLLGEQSEAFSSKLALLTVRRSAALSQPNSTLMPGRSNRWAAIPRELLRKHCHLLPLRKADSGSYMARMSVGRTRNHDVVLRHATVSKFHAWLEIQDGKLFVGDAGSRNQTLLNGARVESRSEVTPGSALKFGSVETFVFESEALWGCMHPQ